MPKKSSPTEMPELFSETVKTMQSAMTVNPIVGPQLEQFWNAQEKLLDEAEVFTRHWFERRHQATRTAMEAARKATSTESGTPAEAMKTIADWQRHSLERMVEDAREWMDMATRCSTFISESEAEVVEEAIQEATKTAGKATRSAKSEPV